MANPIVLLDARLFVAGADLSGYSNKIEIKETAEVKKTTTWRSGGAEENKAGVHRTEWMAEGNFEAGDPSKPDDAFWTTGRSAAPWSAAPFGDSDLAAGSLMYLNKAVRSDYGFLGGVGDVAPWSAQATSTWPLVRGRCAHPSGVARTATGNGTAVQLGAVSATQKIYANLHVQSVSGTSTPTITVKVQSDDNSGFTTPTDRLSFAAKTAAGGEALRLDGAITDTYWRVAWTVTGSTPSFLFLVSFGIE